MKRTSKCPICGETFELYLDASDPPDYPEHEIEAKKDKKQEGVAPKERGRMITEKEAVEKLARYTFRRHCNELGLSISDETFDNCKASERQSYLDDAEKELDFIKGLGYQRVRKG